MKNLLLLLLLLPLKTFCQQTFEYAEKDGQKLYLDVYKSENPNADYPLLIYVFGGGFIGGERYSSHFLPFIDKFNKKGFNVVCIDYRLGLKNSGVPGVFNFKPLKNSIDMAVEDLLSATEFLKHNENLVGVNAQKIVTVGSSAGAITVLQADYELKNGFKTRDFNFDGVVAFSGAIFSQNGRVRYRNSNPAPTLFFHGTKDKVVTYKQISFFKVHFSGTKILAKRFKKHHYPYYAFHYLKLGHEVNFYVNQDFDNVVYFVEHLVLNPKNNIWSEDITLRSSQIIKTSVKNTQELYKNN